MHQHVTAQFKPHDIENCEETGHPKSKDLGETLHFLVSFSLFFIEGANIRRIINTVLSNLSAHFAIIPACISHNYRHIDYSYNQVSEQHQM